MPQADMLMMAFDRYYSSEYVYQEGLGGPGKAHFVGEVSWHPVRPGTLVIETYAGGHKLKLQDDGKGRIVGDVGGRSGINYQTGEYSIMLPRKATSQVLASYYFEMVAATSASPEPTQHSDRIKCEWCGRTFTWNEHGCPGCGATP